MVRQDNPMWLLMLLSILDSLIRGVIVPRRVCVVAVPDELVMPAMLADAPSLMVCRRS